MKKTFLVLVQWYTEAVFLLSPLIVTNDYANITATKGWFFIVITGILAFTALCMVKDTRSLIKFNFPSLAAFVFAGLSLVSALISAYGNGFTGSDGRFMGVAFFAAAAACILVMTNVQVKSSAVLWIAFISEAIVIIIAVLNFVGVDFMGLVSAVPEFARGRYLSTIGYGNYLSEYISIMTVLEILFLTREDTSQKKRGSRVPESVKNYGLLFLLFLGYTGLLISNSSCGFIGTAAAVSLFPFFIREKEDWKKLGSSLIPLPFSCAFGKLLFRHTILGVGEPGADPVVRFLLQWPVIIGLTVLAAAVLVLLICLNRKDFSGKVQKKSPSISANCVKIYGIFYITAVVLAIVFVILSNTGVLVSRLTLTDTFANNRGYIWKQALRLYLDLPFVNQLFGIGPEELLPFFSDTIGADAMMAAAGQVFDSAHNFILNYLLTVGAAAAAVLLAGLILGIREIIKRRNEHTALFFLPFICYLIQALVIPSTPIVTPLAIMCFCIAYRGVAD